MHSPHTQPIPVTRILLGSILIPWINRSRYSRALAFPTLLMVVAWTALLISISSTAASFIPAVFFLIAFSIVSVTCHRLILAPASTSSFGISFSFRELKFAGWVVLIYLIYNLITIVPLTTLINIEHAAGIDLNGTGIVTLTLISSIPAMYVLARICLVFPATAIDQGLSPIASWSLTRHNGLRLIVIVGLYPWATQALIWLISRDDPSSLEQAITLFLYYIGSIIEVFALSLTYQEFTQQTHFNNSPA